MGLFSGKKSYGHIDRSTGRNRRDKSVMKDKKHAPERWNGKIVRGGRKSFQRSRKTGIW